MTKPESVINTLIVNRNTLLLSLIAATNIGASIAVAWVARETKKDVENSKAFAAEFNKIYNS